MGGIEGSPHVHFQSQNSPVQPISQGDESSSPNAPPHFNFARPQSVAPEERREQTPPPNGLPATEEVAVGIYQLL